MVNECAGGLLYIEDSVMTAARIIIIAISALVGATACRQPLPCDDCDALEDEQDVAEDPVPDLPCGGADLMTDNDNCGVCENECNVWYEGTEWEGGNCQAGECGPSWGPVGCFNSTANGATCEELCELVDLDCVPAGCSGLTAMLLNVSHFSIEGCSLDDGPDATMTGACTDPIPWETTDEWDRHVMCCCG